MTAARIAAVLSRHVTTSEKTRVRARIVATAMH
jgi:hypothetical protein